MAKCTHCGKQYPDGTDYCPDCGSLLKNDYTQKGNSYFQDAVNHVSYTNREKTEFTNGDIQKNKTLAIFSYIGLLVLIPVIAAKKSPYVKFHANQGLVLCIIEGIYWILRRLLLGIGRAHFLLWGFRVASYALGMLEIIFFCFSIMGIIQICNGQAKPLPLIGKIRILK